MHTSEKCACIISNESTNQCHSFEEVTSRLFLMVPKKIVTHIGTSVSLRPAVMLLMTKGFFSWTTKSTVVVAHLGLYLDMSLKGELPIKTFLKTSFSFPFWNNDNEYSCQHWIQNKESYKHWSTNNKAEHSREGQHFIMHVKGYFGIAVIASRSKYSFWMLPRKSDTKRRVLCIESRHWKKNVLLLLLLLTLLLL